MSDEAAPQGPGNDGQTPPAANKDFLIVGMGASAGGVQALKEFFTHVPARSGMAYVVILHLSPDHDSQLAQVLQTVAQIPVTQVTERVTVTPDHVYVVPPNEHLTMLDGDIIVSPNTSIEERRAPVDIFFRTLADSHHARAVCVVLSGTGANGSMGLKRVKERGGAAFVQDPREAEFSEMPRNSIATELVDAVLRVAEIPARIIAYKESLGTVAIPVDAEARPEVQQHALREIFTHLRLRTGHDFANYKRPTMLRRIERRINVRNLPDLPTYAAYIRDNRDEANALLKDLLISVTNFFRDRPAFEYFETDVLLKIFHGKTVEDQVRLWVCGCATGEEAYSLAMLCAERTLGMTDAPTVQIFATDIDEQAIATAREGYYTLNDAADVSPERLRRFFTKEGDGYRVRRELRESILFALHNVIKDPPFSHLDAVTCRNLLIYLNTAAQERVMETFHFALNPGGYLFLGNSESVDGASDLYATVSKQHQLFQSRQVAVRLTYPVPETMSARHFEKFQPPRQRSLPAEGPPAPRALERISYSDLHQQLLEQYAPPSVVVNEEYDIVHLSEGVGRYLQVAGGEPTKNLLKLIRPELRLELRTALFQAVQHQTNVEVRDLPLRVAERDERINIYARPVLRVSADMARGFILVLFEPAQANAAAPETAYTAHEPIVGQLEAELVRTKAQLRHTIEQLEIQAEELKASNEELQAMNEELRSAAEELETSKEELQSVNEELITVNQELKIKIEELGQANNDIQNLINSTGIATIFLDRNFRVNSFTPAATRIFNLIAADYGRSISDITHRLETNDLIHNAEEVLDTLRAVEREVRTTDGRAYLLRVMPYRTKEDRINGVVASFVDITERKHAEDRVRESEERLQRAIAIETVGVIFFNNDIELIDCNDAFLRMSGFTRDEIKAGRFSWEVFTPAEFSAPSLRAIEELNTQGFTTPYEKQYIRKDGSRFWAMFSCRRISANESVEFVTDISEQKRIEAAMRESEERLRALVENLPGGAVFIIDRDLRYLIAEGEALAPAGFKPQDLIGRTIAEAMPPELAAEYEPKFRAALAGTAFDYEHDAHGRSFISRGVPLRGANGDIYAVLAISYDITARKLAEKALRESEIRYRAIVGQSTAGITELDLAGMHVLANPGYCETLGYTEAELLHMNLRDITHPDDQACCLALFADTIKTGTPHVSEKRIVRKDGSHVWITDSISLITDAHGHALRVATVAIDITERKRAEAALHALNEQLEGRVRERTVALTGSNTNLQAEIAERRKAERERAAVMRRLVVAQEDERRRVAREIHDHLGQQSTALRLNLAALKDSCAAYTDLAALLEQTQTIAARLDADVDFLAWELRPASLDDLGLPAALANFVKDWTTHFKIPVEFHTTGLEQTRLAPETEINLYRIAQEALNNIAKYAQARRVEVLLERRDQHVALIVEDDGSGFDPEALAQGQRALGLVGMRERAALVGGALEIESAPGAGTTIFARVPLVLPGTEALNE